MEPGWKVPATRTRSFYTTANDEQFNYKREPRGVKKFIVGGKELAGNILPVRPPQPRPIQVEAVIEG
jgi:hypothetical protein